MDGPYKIVGALYHDGPVRSMCVSPYTGEILAGSQSKTSNVHRWLTSYDNCIDGLEFKSDDSGNPIYHDNWITSLICLPPNRLPMFPEGCIITGCMDCVIRIFDLTGNPISELVGHSKGIISLSWTSSYYLLSGSWDGTAKIWNISNASCVCTMSNHENGVHILGLSNNRVATTSSGESVNNKPANFKLRIWDIAALPNPENSSSTSSSVRTYEAKLLSTIEDHNGPIRSICSLNMDSFEGYATTSNDGSTIIRTADGSSIGILFHPASDDGTPPMILDSCALYTKEMSHVSCGEDGSVCVWNGTELLQSIPHPSCVWCVVAIPGTDGDFLTGCNDGVVRIFSKEEAKTMNSGSLELQVKFLESVYEELKRRRIGPSQEEINKATKWSDRGKVAGSSEGQVMVFNKDGKMIAAQWSAISGTWIEIGDVTGSTDAGEINGITYDHVMPVEMETPNGILTLRLGYNNKENPYDAAQRFIDTNSLNQSFLRQIAEWIVSNAGKNVPTIGTDLNSTVVSNSINFKTIPLYAIIPSDEIPSGFKVKVISKIKEFNVDGNLTDEEITTIEYLIDILQDLSHYHSSNIYPSHLTGLFKIINWDVAKCFPSFDICRIVAIHPSGSKTLAEYKQFSIYLQRISDILADRNSPSSATLTAIRFISNALRHDELRNNILKTNLNITRNIFQSLTLHINSNKSLRVAIATLCMNLSLYVSTIQNDEIQLNLVTILLTIIKSLISSEQEAFDVIVRGLLMIGTLCIKGGDIEKSFVQANATELRSIINTLNSSLGHKLDSNAKQVLDEVLLVLQL